MASAVILADGVGLPVFVNAKASRLLDEGDGLSTSIAGLVGSDPESTRRLREAIAAAASEGPATAAPLIAVNGHRPAGRCLALVRPSQRPALLLTLLPVWRLEPAIAGAPPARVAIFVTEPDEVPGIDETALCDTFGFRRREAETVALLAAGLRPPEIAAQLDISLGTVRNYLKHAFQNTNTHSQAALVALVRGFTKAHQPLPNHDQ